MIFIRNVFHFKIVNNLLKTFNPINKMNLSTNSRIKTIEFKTCGQLYEELKKNNKLFRNSPSDGLPVNVEYVDTFTDNQSSGSDVKTIVAIHGNPGNHQHFKDICDYFGTNGSKVRVIVPNMPDFSITRKTMAFWHSNEERAQFIRDFLKAINVSTIDCLISHSVGIHAISLIWSEIDTQRLTIKSIGLLSPQYLPERFFVIARTLSKLCRNKIGISLMDRYKPHISAKAILPVSFSTVDQVLCFFLLQSDIKNTEYYQYLENLRLKQIPILVVFGERDKAIPKKDFEEFAERLGANTKDIISYSDGIEDIENETESKNFVKVLSFKTGGHFCYAKYSEEVNKQLAKHCLKI